MTGEFWEHFEQDFPPLDKVLRKRPLTPEVLYAAAQARLNHLEWLAAVLQAGGFGSYPRDVLGLFAAEVTMLAGEVRELLVCLQADEAGH